MGNNITEPCGCSNRQKDQTVAPKSLPTLHKFRDKKIKVFDYTGRFKYATSLIKLSEIFPSYYPIEIRCFNGSLIESRHSYVRVLGLYASKRQFKTIFLEVYYKRRRMVVNIRPENISEKELNEDIGNLQLIHVCSETAVIFK